MAMSTAASAAGALPNGPPSLGGPGAMTDTAFNSRQRRNGVVAGFEQQNCIGPWIVPGRTCVPEPWPAALIPPNTPLDHFQRPSLLMVPCPWPARPVLAPVAPAPWPTRIHLKKTKLINYPCDAMVIPTDNTMLINNTSNLFQAEWLTLADDPFVPVGTLATGFLAAARPAGLPQLTAQAMPPFANSRLNTMHVLVHCEVDAIVAQAAIPAHVYPPGIGTPIQRADYHLRQCYYIALREASNPTVLPGAAVNIAALSIASIGGIAQVWPAVRTIAIPIMGIGTPARNGYGFDRAADQAGRALKEWFWPTLNSETVQGLAAPALLVERTRRRQQFDDIFVCIPNGTGARIDPPQATAALDIYRRPMGELTHAAHQAFFKHLRCPTCSRGKF
ncbi:uncharacterized protein LY89DRAFT_788947 [Mollisia scopiformis]|uniref:Uncharacterized protein n=1 Tax=Mollisia scopiformis TaxID=149040 RepID=A0A132B9B3_MOLSC|nr:uncharacterized protein LY89DRAFT_788947 [Mollisia scopiformis]KUJ08589.1 hypothetical protein LY89DRAFT_788947 [Mollisia scopiformis]